MEEENYTQDEGANEFPAEGTQEDAAPAIGDMGAEAAPHSEEMQDADENARFAAARRRAEAEAAQKYGAEQDRLIAELLHGQENPYTGMPITTRAEYDAYREQAAEQERGTNLQQTEADSALLEQALRQSPLMQQAQQMLARVEQAEQQRALSGKLAEIAALDPSVRSIDDLMRSPHFDEFDRLVRQGYRLADAYKLAHFDTLTEKRSAAARQAALNAIGGKSHLTQTRGAAGDEVVVPAETLAMYRSAFPKWTEKQIIADYKKHR